MYALLTSYVCLTYNYSDRFLEASCAVVSRPTVPSALALAVDHDGQRKKKKKKSNDFSKFFVRFTARKKFLCRVE